MVLKNQPQRRLGPYWDITGRRRRRFKTNAAWARTEALRADGEEDSKPTTLGPVRRHYGQTEKENQGHAPLVFPHRLTLCLTVPFSPLVSPHRFPLSSPRTVFPSRLTVNFLYGAKWLWFYGSKDSKPTPLGPVRGHYGQTEKEKQGHAPLVSPYRFPLLSHRFVSP